MNRSNNHPINKLYVTNQSTHQPYHPSSINQQPNQTVHQPTDQRTDRPTNRSARRAVVQPFHWGHRQGAHREGGRRIGWRDGEGHRPRGHPLPYAQPPEGASRERAKGPGGPRHLPDSNAGTDNCVAAMRQIRAGRRGDPREIFNVVVVVVVAIST